MNEKMRNEHNCVGGRDSDFGRSGEGGREGELLELAKYPQNTHTLTHTQTHTHTHTHPEKSHKEDENRVHFLIPIDHQVFRGGFGQNYFFYRSKASPSSTVVWLNSKIKFYPCSKV